jgi:hypothetical protein
MSGSRKIPFLLLLAVMLLSGGMPVQPVCEMTVHAEHGPCHDESPPAGRLEVSKDAEGTSHEECCAAGCQDCTLPCCARTAMIPAQPPFMSGTGAVAIRHLPASDGFPLVDYAPLGRPPRT